MYTNSVDSEMEFLLELSKSSSADMKDGDCVEVRACPNCENGIVITRCIHKEQYKKFEHYCKECGEIFSISKIKAEVFFNKQNWVLKELKTPVGDFVVKLNNEPFQFKYGVHIYENKAANKSIMINKMSVDSSKLKTGDILNIGFSEEILEIDDSKEDGLYFGKKDGVILGLCLYLPKEVNFLKVKDVDKKGITCEIISDDESYKYINFAIAFVNISDYNDAHKEITLALKEMSKSQK